MDIKQYATAAALAEAHACGELLGLVSVPADAYHAGPGISSTGLKAMQRSPRHYQAGLAEPTDSEALRLGRLIHTRVLEPDVYEATCVRAPRFDRRTKLGKADAEDFEAAHRGKVLMSDDDVGILDGIADSIFTHARAAQLFTGGVAELSAYWTDDATGVLCRARADLINGSTIVDLKTCQDARPSAFRRDVDKYGYALSAAFYLDGFRAAGLEVSSFVWAAVEKAKPHGVRLYSASREHLTAGAEDYRAGLEAYAKAVSTGSWPCYTTDFETLEWGNYSRGF